MMQEEHNRKPRRVQFLRGMLVAGAAGVLFVFFLLLRPSGDVTYRFMTAVDHPIDVMAGRSGRWFHYGPGRMTGNSAQIAATVRRELLPLGFTEDTSSKPWFRFVKGKREVIVCNHDEIAPNASLMDAKIFHEPPSTSPLRVPSPVLWVHQSGGDMGVITFQIKKLLLRW